MKEEWHLAYEGHGIFFGIAFLLLTASCLRATVSDYNTMPLFAKSRISYAINAVLVIFTLSRAVALLLHRYYTKDEVIQVVFAFEKFLFNVGFPCLIAAYARMIYPCLEYLKDGSRRVFDMVLVHCYLFLIAEISEIMIPYSQHVSLHVVGFILSLFSFVSGLCAYIVYAKNFYSSSSNDIEKSNDLKVEIIETTSCETPANQMNKRKGTIKNNIITLSLSCIWIIYVGVRICIISGQIQVWSNEIDMEGWYSWMYANILRMIEFGNAAIMSHLVQRVTLKRKFPF